MERIERHACFGGWQDVYQHHSKVLGCSMKFAAYLPPETDNKTYPVIYWLSGLTCNEQNFINKSGAQQFAAEHGVILIAPDTSPRGEQVADDDAYDLGQGAGFYINALMAPWSRHYNMYDYIVSELPALVEANLPANGKRAICGHSMGGHGALMIGLRNPERYTSLSAFAPIIAPSQVPWGQKAFMSYLGEDKSLWSRYDTVNLLNELETTPPMLVDVGTDDPFFQEQLQPELLDEVCRRKQHDYTLNLREGYDHSYYFIASFIGDHIAFHAQHLKR
ncbi:S-formylglutathione hydrolase [Providencia burhodogranariea]|uniref:S-formylglutathione hydrolase n=1 Tax=Providencia burhodogranariea DSM 19968 TaxID=1141662 RepID=K8WQX8_9GAMM|nr:S-formylglutathione hydrolase [Providencia burhodogranariea]EKT63019.1 esterase [Providencia burhodogranariea DSM 19968]